MLLLLLNSPAPPATAASTANVHGRWERVGDGQRLVTPLLWRGLPMRWRGLLLVRCAAHHRGIAASHWGPPAVATGRGRRAVSLARMAAIKLWLRRRLEAGLNVRR